MSPLQSSGNLDSVINVATHLSARAAAERLGVSRATLYAYVSRGAIRSRAVPGSRAREYAREDVERLAAQTRGRRDPLAVARGALGIEGLPVVSSALTLIDGGRLYYRGQDAVELSREAPFEQVAALLWGGPCLVPAAARRPNADARRGLARLDFPHAALSFLATAAGSDPGAGLLAPDVVRACGARIIAELTALACGFAEVAAGGRVASRLASSFERGGARLARTLDAALILCADHELNASAFAARVIAGARATPYMAVSGALAALSGSRHGGITAAIQALFESSESADELVARRLAHREPLDGFGHPLYPDGDPRAQRLLELCPAGAERRRAARLVDAVEHAAAQRPNLDFGLVALCRSLGLPPAAPFVLFAIGRTAGWIAHTLEQYATGEMIRPRARYDGLPPPNTPR